MAYIYKSVQKTTRCNIYYKLSHSLFQTKTVPGIKCILNHFDIIAVSPTAYVKSCLFRLLPGFLLQSEEKGIVIVVSPLNPIIIDQLNTLKKVNIKTDILKDVFNNESSISNLFSSLSSEEDIKNVLDDVKNVCVKVLFSRPKS